MNNTMCKHQKIGDRKRWAYEGRRYELFLYCTNSKLRRKNGTPEEKFLETSGDICNVCPYKEKS